MTASPSSSQIARVIVAALQYRDGPAPRVDWASLTSAGVVAASDRHRVGPALWRFAKAAHAPAEYLEPLSARYEEQIVRHLTVSGDLEWLAGILDRVHVPWLVMKGPVLSDAVWPRPDMREYFDLDVLVAPGQFGAAIAALIDAGAQLIDCNWPLINRQLRGELTLLLPFGTPLDLHWNLINNAEVRRDFPLCTDDFLARAISVRLGSCSYPTFDPADTLLTVAFHAAHAGATNLVWMKDVERAAAAPGVVWDEVDRRARVTGLNLALTVVLARACRALGTSAPPTPGWRRERGLVPQLARVVDRIFPVGRSQAGHSGQLLYRSIRGSGRATIKAAFDTVAHPPKSWGVGSENPLHRNVPDAGARSAFFEVVERSSHP